jgi:type IV secretion system protein TrbL
MGTAASTAAQLGRETGGSSIGGMAAAARGAAARKMESTFGLGAAAERGRTAAWAALNRTPRSSTAAGGGEGSEGAPAWARSMRAQQTARHHRQLAVHTLQQGDRGGGSATPDIKERND